MKNLIEELSPIIQISIFVLLFFNIIYLVLLSKSIPQVSENSKDFESKWYEKYIELKWHINSLKMLSIVIGLTGAFFGYDYYSKLNRTIMETKNTVADLTKQLDSISSTLLPLRDSIKGAGKLANKVSRGLNKINQDLSGTAEQIYLKYKAQDILNIISNLHQSPEKAFDIYTDLYSLKFDKNYYRDFKKLYFVSKNSTSEEVYATILYKNFPKLITKDIELYPEIETYPFVSNFAYRATSIEVMNCLDGFLSGIKEKEGFIEERKRVTDFLTTLIINYNKAVDNEYFKSKFSDKFYDALANYQTRKIYYENFNDGTLKQGFTNSFLKNKFKVDLDLVEFNNRQDSLDRLIKQLDD